MDTQVHILLVDDEPTVQMVHLFMLKKLGCYVDVANNGKEAIEKATENRYDIIFMDMGLPDMRGSEATKVIKGQGVDTPVIMLSAYAQSEIKDECDSADIKEIYQKPVSGDTFSLIVKKYT